MEATTNNTATITTTSATTTTTTTTTNSSTAVEQRMLEVHQRFRSTIKPRSLYPSLEKCNNNIIEFNKKIIRRFKPSCYFNRVIGDTILEYSTRFQQDVNKIPFFKGGPFHFPYKCTLMRDLFKHDPFTIEYLKDNKHFLSFVDRITKLFITKPTTTTINSDDNSMDIITTEYSPVELFLFEIEELLKVGNFDYSKNCKQLISKTGELIADNEFDIILYSKDLNFIIVKLDNCDHESNINQVKHILYSLTSLVMLNDRYKINCSLAFIIDGNGKISVFGASIIANDIELDFFQTFQFNNKIDVIDISFGIYSFMCSGYHPHSKLDTISVPNYDYEYSVRPKPVVVIRERLVIKKQQQKSGIKKKKVEKQQQKGSGIKKKKKKCSVRKEMTQVVKNLKKLVIEV